MKKMAKRGIVKKMSIKISQISGLKSYSLPYRTGLHLFHHSLERASTPGATLEVFWFNRKRYQLKIHCNEVSTVLKPNVLFGNLSDQFENKTTICFSI
ncbi:hypothetical protein CDAR_387691 [Caerostris darwini]|uniref:Uncharacterized protein n=1 Tax=Caerostris darwini TaxID=1538125 RepID=A0AAV4W2F6_9ARAC|nr:hypothetical protein CDAR_387691 [Caerostris darwini]